MRRCSGWVVLVGLFLSFAFSIPCANAQVDRIEIAAGTDEDHALQAISNEPDAQKKLPMYQEFVQKFSANPAAVAYGNWQISQAYQASGDLQKAYELDSAGETPEMKSLRLEAHDRTNDPEAKPHRP